MIFSYILTILSGIGCGVFTGITPGIHVNTLSALIISIVPFLNSIGLENDFLVVFISSLAITHTFFDVLPGLFLGIPGEDTFAQLPGHRLVKQGLGGTAVRLSVFGSSFGVISGSIIVLCLISFFDLSHGVDLKDLYKIIEKYLFFILIGVSAILILTENNKFSALFVFILSGFFGLAVMNSPIVSGGEGDAINSLFPSLTGMFGISGILWALITSEEEQASFSTGKVQPLKIISNILPSLKGSIAGILVGLLPGLGSANAATLLLLTEGDIESKQGFEADKRYLVTTSALNTTDALFAIGALYLIEKSRSGASIAIARLLPEGMNYQDLNLIIIAALSAGIVSFFIMWNSGDFIANGFKKINYNALNWSLISFIVLLTCFFLGFGGMSILIASTVIGLVPMVLYVRKAQLMGFFMLPTIFYYSSFAPFLHDIFRVSYKTGCDNHIPISHIFIYFLLSLLASIIFYYLMKNIKNNSSFAYKFLYSFSVIGFFLIAIAFLYKPSNDFDEYKSIIVNGNNVQIIDGDTIKTKIGGKLIRIRLQNIDAPEINQDFGNESKLLLKKLIFKNQITIEPNGFDRYGRIIAVIKNDNLNINHEMVKAGYAWVYTDYNTDRKISELEDNARLNHIGLWKSLAPIAPWEHRRDHQ